MLQAQRILAILALSSSGLLAQTAQITGRVTDPSHAAVIGASVSITHLDTGIRREVKTANEGYFTEALLPRGNYSVKVEMAGFQAAKRADFILDEGQVVRLDFELKLGQVSETVTVTGANTMLETETGTMSTVVGEQEILDLPLPNRNVLGLAALVPGVRPLVDLTGLSTSSISNMEASVGGGPPTGTNTTIDGAGADEMGFGGVILSLSVDAVAEFRIITKNAGAEYGHTTGGVISFVSKSGTNEVHGSLFEFVKNKEFNANDFFNNMRGAARPQLINNNYGASAGGPVVIPRLYHGKNKTFFFVNWERYSRRTYSSVLRTVPTELQREGDFSQTFTAQGKLLGVYDPSTTQTSTTTASGQIRQPFPGNVIPKSRISPVASAVQAYYPLGNTAGLPVTQLSNYFGFAGTPVDKTIYGIKVDHNFTPNQRIAARYSYDNAYSNPGNFFNNAADPSDSPIHYIKHSGMLNYVDTITPTVLVTAVVGLNRYFTPRTVHSYGFDVGTIGLNPALNTETQIPMFPQFVIGDVGTIGGDPADNIRKSDDTYTESGSLTWIRSGHAFKFGGESRLYQGFDSQLSGVSNLGFSFSRNWTAGPDPTAIATSGYGYASFLLGTPDSGLAGYQLTRAYSEKYFALYGQDDWKLTPKLTLNIGVRWEHQGAYTDRHNGFSNFNPNLAYTVGGVPLEGGFTFVGVDGNPRGDRNTRWLDFAPRFGFAYKLPKETVVRGGYGWYFGPITAMNTRFGDTGFSSQSVMTTSLNALTFTSNLANPFPNGIATPTGSQLGTLTGLGSSISDATLRSLWGGLTQQWNFNIQHIFSKTWLLEVGYEGNHATSQPQIMALHFLPQTALALKSGLSTAVANPYAGIITGALGSPKVSEGTLLTTYPQFTGLSGYNNWGDSIYHALTGRFEHRLSSNLSLMVAYTFSKMIDNGIRASLDDPFGSESVQNWSNLRAERAVSGINLPQRLVLTGTYNLRFGERFHGIRRQLAAGWQLNSVITLQSGSPIAVTATAPSYTGFRPNLVGDPTEADPTISRWLNIGAFANTALYTYGNGPRNLPSTRTEAGRNWDLSVMRKFKVKERWQLEFRAEAFNVLNHVTFGEPGTNINTGTFGIVQTESPFYAPRNVQFGLKLYF